jgi:hypothetical protein
VHTKSIRRPNRPKWYAIVIVLKTKQFLNSSPRHLIKHQQSGYVTTMIIECYLDQFMADKVVIIYLSEHRCQL